MKVKCTTNDTWFYTNQFIKKHQLTNDLLPSHTNHYILNL